MRAYPFFLLLGIFTRVVIVYFLLKVCKEFEISEIPVNYMIYVEDKETSVA